MRRTRPSRAAVLIAGAVALAAALIAGSVGLRVPDPPSASSAAVMATRLEALLPVLDEAGVTSWTDAGHCQYIERLGGERREQPADCGDFPLFTAQDAVVWDRIAAAAAGMIPGARLLAVDVMESGGAGGGSFGRTVLFEAVPAARLGFDAPFARWYWRWSDGDTASSPAGMPPGWTFWAADAAVV